MQTARLVAKMKSMPTEDKLFGTGTIRTDGRKIHDIFLFEVKKPEESKGPWGSGIKPSRCASFLAALRARRTASAFSRVLRSDGFSYALRRFISRKMPSRCIFFLRALRACSTLLSRTNTCKMFPIVVAHQR
jgi:Fe-S-cluster containining protein